MEKEVTRPVRRLSDADRDAIAAYGARATWPAGFTLYERGTRADGIFLVARGRIVLRNRVKSGRGFVPAIIVAGETFGAEGLSPGSQYATDASAETESETLYLGSSKFRTLMREQPVRAMAIVAQVMQRVPMRLLGYCVMPNHWHMVLWPRPRNDGDLARFMQRLTVTHARRWQLHRHCVGQGHVY